MPTVSKFFRVATEGATTDGRTIDRTTLQQMADSFNPAVYGARIWMDHMRGIFPDSPFKAYGDVTALKTEEVDTPSGKKMGLFAQISPTPDLVALSKARQKIYTSMEISPKFADTERPYLVGLGITDTPASLGTDVLQFAAGATANANPFTARKRAPENLFSEAVEVMMEFEDEAAPDDKTGLSVVVKNLINRFSTKKTGDDERFSDVTEAFNVLTGHLDKQGQQFASMQATIKTLQTDLHASNAAFAAFKKQMDTEEATPGRRPPAIGGPGIQQTDF